MALSARFSHNISKNEEISLARQGMGLPMSILGKNHNINDAVFVSIDFENVDNLARDPDKPNLKTQMGVCILDSRQIGTSSAESILQNYNFTTGNWTAKDKNLLFGQTQQTTVRELTSKLENLIDRKRNIILIAHDDHFEQVILKKLEFDLSTGISGFIDTQKIMKEVCVDENGEKTYNQNSLTNLLKHLDIKYQNLHVGGNDAHFTMKAFLKMIICSFREEMELGYVLADEVQETLHNLADIAKTELSSSKDSSNDANKSQKQQPVKELQKAQPIKQQPKAQQPVTKKPITKPSVQKPIVQKPIVQKPIVQKPIIKKPTVQKPIVQKPVFQQPIVQQPFVQPAYQQYQMQYLLQASYNLAMYQQMQYPQLQYPMLWQPQYAM